MACRAMRVPRAFPRRVSRRLVFAGPEPPPPPPCPHRFGDVLQGLRPDVVKSEVDLAANLTLRVIGNADPARLRDALEAGRGIDAIAEDVVVVDDDVADMNADPEVDPG